MAIAFKRILALLFGVLLFFATAEVMSRVVFQKVVRYDVEMWRYARQVKTVGLTPGLRFEHRPNVQTRLMGVDVKINTDGLRDREYSRQKGENTVRIAVVGDSITFGWGVDQEQTYPRQLERELNRQRPLGPDVTFEVLNFGVGNYGITDVAAMLQSKAFFYQPDLVLYGAFINDAEIPNSVRSGGGLLQNSVFSVWLWGRVDALWRQLGWRADYRDYYLGMYREGQGGPPLVKNTLSAMQKLCKEQHVPLALLLFPELHDDSGAVFAPIREFYQQTSKEAGVDYFDLQETLPERELRQYWVSADDSHPNAEAFLLFARHVAKTYPWQKLLSITDQVQ